MKECGINHLCSAVFHQNSNGQAERFVQALKKGLKSNKNGARDRQENINEYLIAYRATPSTVTGECPSEMFLERNIRTRIDSIKPGIVIGNRQVSLLSTIIPLV